MALRRLVAWLVRLAGGAPNHLALIMDGNRRYARMHGLASAVDGHQRGFAKLIEALEWCRDLDVKVLTVYAFSSENFRRSHAEVDALMKLAETKLSQLASDESLHKREVRVRVCGELHLLPSEVRRAADAVMRATEKYERHTLNIMMPYTSREELWSAARRCATSSSSSCTSSSLLSVPDECGEESSDADLSRLLYTAPNPPVDLLVRTSGENRLSDFLTYQASDAALVFLDVLWPALTFWDLLSSVVRWQAFSAQRRWTQFHQNSNVVATAKKL